MNPRNADKVSELITKNLAVPFAKLFVTELPKLLEEAHSGWTCSNEHALSVFGRRAKHVKKLGLPIYGLDAVVANIGKRDQDDQVRIYSFRREPADAALFMIFTDEQTETLLGIVAFDKTTAK
jgi:hypothetical protein